MEEKLDASNDEKVSQLLTYRVDQTRIDHQLDDEIEHGTEQIVDDKMLKKVDNPIDLDKLSISDLSI